MAEKPNNWVKILLLQKLTLGILHHYYIWP